MSGDILAKGRILARNVGKDSPNVGTYGPTKSSMPGSSHFLVNLSSVASGSLSLGTSRYFNPSCLLVKAFTWMLTGEVVTSEPVPCVHARRPELQIYIDARGRHGIGDGQGVVGIFCNAVQA